MAKRFIYEWFSLLLIMGLLFSLVVGCGTPANTNSSPDVEQNEPVSATTTNTLEEIADKYFAQMPYHIYKIAEQDLKYRVDVDDADTLIIDIRAPEDYAKGHIKDAANIPFGAIHEFLDKLPVDKEIIVCCYTGERAGQAVAILNMYGYNAKSLNLGFDIGWVKNNNFPTDTEVYELPTSATPAQPDVNIALILKDYFANMPENQHIITAANVQKAIEEGQDVQIIDIRSSLDFSNGHIKGAINIPFAKVNEHFTEISRDKPVYVYCYTGQTAGQTVAVLNTIGVNALSIEGGFDLGWIPENLPVEN